MTDNKQSDFADDLLRGAKQIALFLFGDKKYCRRVFYLHAAGRLPTFTMGNAGLCARKSTLLGYFEKQERRHLDPQ